MCGDAQMRREEEEVEKAEMEEALRLVPMRTGVDGADRGCAPAGREEPSIWVKYSGMVWLGLCTREVSGGCKCQGNGNEKEIGKGTNV